MLAMDDNKTLQAEEIEALSSIYGKDYTVISEDCHTYNIHISSENKEDLAVDLQVTLPPEYPTEAPPFYQIHAPWLKGFERLQVSAILEDLFCEHPGECIVYQWVENIRQFLCQKIETLECLSESSSVDSPESIAHCLLLPTCLEAKYECPPIVHGDTISEKKSTFQAHLAHIFTVSQVQQVMTKLKENKKIASATHNILAYRITNEITTGYIQDCDDDGETHAGSRLLKLLQTLDVKNVMVVVSRWYGGILLGPGRFRHINNCARQVIAQAGLIKPSDESSKKLKN